jgi:hypothetical protein
MLWWLVACGDAGTSPSAKPVDVDGDGVSPGEDCDDTNAEIHPGAEERCNAIDDDCDGRVDVDAVDEVEVFTDADADGFGGEPAGLACVAGADQATVAGDCDDRNSGAHPGAVEVCDGGVDDDCNGAADDDDDAADKGSYYADGDGDGFTGGTAFLWCAPPPALAPTHLDCDDGNAAVHPGAVELCNGVDDDCDAVTTETGVVSVDGAAYWRIQDAVDAATAKSTVSICEGTWFENVEVRRDVVLEGRDAELSIIDGSGTGSVVRAGGWIGLTLRHLTLRNGQGDVTRSDESAGGGVEARDAGMLFIDGCVIADNAADVGGGIYGPTDGNALVVGSVLRGNSAVDGGGAYFPNESPYLADIRESEIVDNVGEYRGAGLYFEPERSGRANGAISDTLIDGNVGTSKTMWSAGGGIYSSGTLTLAAVTISNNAALYGGGAYVTGTATADDKTLVEDNATTEGGFGGGLAVYGTWKYGTIEGNTAGYGGGVALTGTLVGAAVEENHASVGGGGVWLWWRGAEITDSTIDANESDGTGGGIGTEADWNTDMPLLDTVTITRNVAATSGGGARLEMGLQCQACDWGTGATDNSPDDISLVWDGDEVVYDDFSAAEDFVCVVDDLVCE